ncbi:PadR family transcriptional regulator [Prauserella muralis]|uniref:PadR family transcriptional regulator n=1 Tax=Prauserella muralis TaxID=588067 RepID=A0A2V4AGT0_9PSEU|nr:PadR family transcriptional regulator [Prauserella muralis]PXY19132.1 PadR family transcriptional regulator [Prauserella muralis]TWE29041.1 DNA-binding PadR family transcriptional regulator [Prauserella muralis]
MAGRRKVNNLLALAVLSAVVERPMHPYEIASVLRARGKEDDMRIKWGSFYTVVRNLAKHGFIEVVDSTREGARPERTVYRITEAGHSELVDWARELVSTPARDQSSFRAGLSVLAGLSPDEATELLRQRLDALRGENAALRESLERHRKDVPRLFLVEDEYQLAISEAEERWVGSLVDELASGTFPGLPLWRQWHATGELPPDVAAAQDRQERGTQT